jgi:outer membrane lipoprotein-sorting protein
MRSLARHALPIALLALAACPRGGVPRDLAADPERLVAELRERQDRAQRVRGMARVRIDAPGMKGTVNELVAAEKPARVRLETLDFFGNPVAVLVADGDRFGFYDARSHTYWRGDATPENVSRFLPVVLEPAELVTILCGSAPLLPGRPLEAQPLERRARLVIGAGEVGQQLVLGDGLAVESSRVRRTAATAAEEAAFYDLEFGRFRDLGGVRFPIEVRLEAASARSTVRMTWRDDVEVNGRLERALFDLAPPRGAKVVDLPPGAPVPEVELPLQQE